MIRYPNAKINLGLNVLRKREDGFHDIESVFYPVPWCDILEVVPQQAGKGEVVFSSTGIPIPSDGKPDLCEQVYHLFDNGQDLPSIRLHLHKSIPIGAGLGGGSADAAFTAVLLNEMFGLGRSTQQLEQLVAQVGSDCAFFVRNRPAYVTGRGEVLEPVAVDLSGYWAVLVNPGIHIGTKEAYSGVVPTEPDVSLKDLMAEPIAEWKHRVKNDFERSVFPKYPGIQALKEELYARGAVYASMTGSGSTVFGLFDQRPDLPPYSRQHMVKTVKL